MNNYPVDIENFHNTMLKLEWVSAIESGVDNLEPVNLEMLKIPEFSHLPHASLLRTNGRQLGTTLKFHIDLFIDGIDKTLEPAFKVINNLNKSLNLFIDMYDIPLKD